MRKLISFLALSLVCGYASSSHAYRLSYPLVIDDTNRTATGSVGQVRNAGANIEAISCTVQASGSTLSMSCTARDAYGTKLRTCTSTVPEFVNIAAMVKGDSVISFGWNTTGYCSSVSVLSANTDSTADPKR